MKLVRLLLIKVQMKHWGIFSIKDNFNTDEKDIFPQRTEFDGISADY